ncbi:MAG: TVP38/TMEM64 family protein [Candidatus Binataceae bacterium]
MTEAETVDDHALAADPNRKRPGAGIEAPVKPGGAARAWRFWIGAGALAIAAVAGYRLGAFWYLGDAARLRALVLGMGLGGPILFIALFSVAEGLGFPGVVFVGGAALIWPLWMAILFSWAGGVGAAILGFFFARTIGREWVQHWMPPRVHRYDSQITDRSFMSVLIARLLFFMAPWVHWMFGLSSVRWPVYVVGTAIGLLPGIVLVSVSGKSLFGYLLTQRPSVWIVGALSIAALVYLARRLRPASLG